MCNFLDVESAFFEPWFPPTPRDHRGPQPGRPGSSPAGMRGRSPQTAQFLSLWVVVSCPDCHPAALASASHHPSQVLLLTLGCLAREDWRSLPSSRSRGTGGRAPPPASGRRRSCGGCVVPSGYTDHPSHCFPRLSANIGHGAAIPTVHESVRDSLLLRRS